MELPKEIYVWFEPDGEEGYFLCNEKPEGCEDGEVGVYQLIKVAQKSTKVVIE